MSERDERIARAADGLEGLARVQANAERMGQYTDGLRAALDARSAELAREIVARRTGLDLTNLTPAEERIVQAVCKYVGLMRRHGKDAGRTLTQLRNKGLVGAAEASVTRSTPAQGFEVLAEEGRADLSYEQIVVDYPEEFSGRAVWYSRRTLGLPTELPKPPPDMMTPTQRHTEGLIGWLRARRGPDGTIPPFANAEAAAALGMDDLSRYGRPYGNVQSRLDFACYRARRPPLGLTAQQPFADAWGQQDRIWKFPVPSMAAAAQQRAWTDADFNVIAREARALPGQAHLAWQDEMACAEQQIRDWAFGLSGAASNFGPEPVEPSKETSDRNLPWNLDELLLALELYLRFRDAAFSKEDAQVHELSSFLGRLAAASGRTGDGDFRNTNGVYMKMMNFRRLDPDYIAGGKIGLSRGNRLEQVVWDEFAQDRPGLKRAVAAIRAKVEASEPTTEQPPLRSEPVKQPAEPQVEAMADLARTEEKYLNSTPEEREGVSRKIERGPVGSFVKKFNRFRCQVCEALGLPAQGFRKKNGAFYIEAHHVMPVAQKQVGSLAASNIMTVCATHHRQLHYGCVEVAILADAFEVRLDGALLNLRRPSVATRGRPQASAFAVGEP
jgi:predicted HNH restriction endonuclease